MLDGYNVIRRDPDLRARESGSLEAGRAALLALVARITRDCSDSFTIVFDGARRFSGSAPGGGRVQVVFSRPPETADDVLRRLAAGLREGAVVVTSDRAVQTAARRVGAVAVGAEAFLAAATPAAALADAPKDEADDDDDEALPPRGPRRRPSREARAAQRVLLRLRTR
ncbi:MAG TPA: NYN domain-containing protein [Methylomirabilota bacterium]|nr:NYN domain-containing protein [Methylomirabilota bacterium]